MMATEPMFELVPDCGYFMVTDAQTHEAIAVVEAGGETEARQFFAALRHMLRAPSQVDLRMLGNATLPNEVPVFRRQYLKALQVNAQGKGRLDGTTLH
jgi:hypothetical protein